jgi:hypothetical protein
MDDDQLIGVGVAHLGRFAFLTRDNPFLSSRAALDLGPGHRAALRGLLAADIPVKAWLASSDGTRLLKAVQVGCVPRDVQLVARTGQPAVGAQSVHAFLHAPLFWWLVSILWCIEMGRLLDPLLDDEVIGYRLHPGFLTDPTANGVMFRRRSDAYQRWQGYAQSMARERPGEILAANTIDIRDFFYSICAKPTDLVSAFLRTLTRRPRMARRARVLTTLLDALHLQFGQRCQKIGARSVTTEEDTVPLPVGAPSSQILANLLMSLVRRDLSGTSGALGVAAYADDLMLVTTALPDMSEEISAYLARLGVIASEDDASLQSPSVGQLAVLRVGLEKSSISYSRGVEADEQAEEDAGPTGEWDPYTEAQPSPDWGGRLRTVLRAAYKRERVPRELAREIRQLVAEIRGGLDADEARERVRRILDDVDDGLFLALRPLWAELLIVGIAAFGPSAVQELTHTFRRVTETLEPPADAGPRMTAALSFGLRASWIQALAQALAVSMSEEEREALASETPHLIIRSVLRDLPTRGVVEYARQIRRRRLVPATFVAVPLAEFTSYPGALIGPDAFSAFISWSLEEADTTELVDLIGKAVRFVPLHEVCLAVHLWAGPAISNWLDTAFRVLGAQPLMQLESVEDLRHRASDVLAAAPQEPPKLEADDGLCLRIAMPSIQVRSDQLTALIGGDSVAMAEIGRESQQALRRVVGASVGRRADVLVLPEWSVQPQQLTWLMQRSARAAMLIVAGQAPALRDGAYENRIWIGIPIRDTVGHQECLVPPPRMKRFLSPHERAPLDAAGLAVAPADGQVPSYRWRGMRFASLICFEFADIATRQALRASADMLTVSSWNRDWRYFDAVQEATTRDNYCLTVCVNTGSFPGTRIMRPTVSEKAVVASVHGSEDPTVVSRRIDMTPIVAARAAWRPPAEVLLVEPSDDAKLRDYKALPPR